LEDHGEERRFYQGLIQVAAGYFKLQQGVPAGALKLWRTGIEKIAPYGPVCFGVDVNALVSAVTKDLEDLERAQPAMPTLTPPKISLIA
jgi:predicted metal-dependent hydrolase